MERQAYLYGFAIGDAVVVATTPKPCGFTPYQGYDLNLNFQTEDTFSAYVL
jgi:hypothetical protein